MKFTPKHQITQDLLTESEWKDRVSKDPRYLTSDGSEADVGIVDGVVCISMKSVVEAHTVSLERMLKSVPEPLSPDIQKELPKYQKETEAYLTKIKTATKSAKKWTYEVDLIEFQRFVAKETLSSIPRLIFEAYLQTLANSIEKLSPEDLNDFVSTTKNCQIVIALSDTMKQDYRLFIGKLISLIVADKNLSRRIPFCATKGRFLVYSQKFTWTRFAIISKVGENKMQMLQKAS
jgi:hypothetical protein